MIESLFLPLSLFLLVAVFAGWLTGCVRRHAIRSGMLDHPKARSSHTLPTPRGGGLAIAVVVIAGTIVLHLAGLLGTRPALALGPGAAAVMLIGWLEDRRGLPAAIRAIAYLVASAGALWLLGGVPSIDLGFTRIPLGMAGNLCVLFGLAWMINLYNFMDGTDGLAATQALAAAVFGGLLFFLNGAPGEAWLCLVLAAACAGFLRWNRPPAKIFMGDTGSCTLGFILGVLAVIGENNGAAPVLAWLILLALFVCDATLTLLRRVISGEKWYIAHRSHAYQLLVRAGLSHGRLALYLLTIDVFALGPLAVYVTLNREFLLPGAVTAVAGAALLWIAVQTRLARCIAAGVKE